MGKEELMVPEVDLPRQYYDWLYHQVLRVQDMVSPFSYTLVCDHMHAIPFKALVLYDENRAAEGIELRKEFLRQINYLRLEDADILYPEASILEVLIALSKRADFMIDMPEGFWFAKFLMNLKLDKYTDYYCLTRPVGRVDKILRRFNDRTYDADGAGGLFPLRRPLRDQRRIELWYQMAAYMTENEMY